MIRQLRTFLAGVIVGAVIRDLAAAVRTLLVELSLAEGPQDGDGQTAD